MNAEKQFAKETREHLDSVRLHIKEANDFRDRATTLEDSDLFNVAVEAQVFADKTVLEFEKALAIGFGDDAQKHRDEGFKHLRQCLERLKYLDTHFKKVEARAKGRAE